LLCLTLHAADLAAYRLGDTADADIVAPVPVDVVDAATTAALQASKAQEIPVVFRTVSGVTNAIAAKFLAAFAHARTDWLAELAAQPRSPAGTAVVISAPAGADLLAAFNRQNCDFPVTEELAAEWSRGNDGGAGQEKLLHSLLAVASQRVRPDRLPDGFAVGETVRLVPVAEKDQKLSLAAVQHGSLIPAASLMTVATARALFCSEFPAGQQPFAQALAAFIQPDCFPDAPFTQLVRGTAVYQLVVSDHFDAGEIMVHRGEIIDLKKKAALDALSEKLAAATPAPPTLPLAQAPPPPVLPEVQPLVRPPPAGVSAGWLIFALAAVCAAASTVAFRQFLKGRQMSPLAQPTPQPNAELALALRDAVMQELALQRRELLLAQQAASDEVAALVRRLDAMQVPMQERERAYEERIQMLEKELALRTEENRELLKLKIEGVRRQLEMERGAQRLNFN
jgi:hypothetical protein